MIITAKFSSACLACGTLCQTGARVAYERGAKGVRHLACSEEGKAVIASVEASKAITTDIDIPCREGLDYLPYQKAGIAYALARKGTLIGDEMGLGKTIQAIGVINATNPRDVLIICKASLKTNWKR